MALSPRPTIATPSPRGSTGPAALGAWAMARRSAASRATKSRSTASHSQPMAVASCRGAAMAPSACGMSRRRHEIDRLKHDGPVESVAFSPVGLRACRGAMTSQCGSGTSGTTRGKQSTVSMGPPRSCAWPSRPMVIAPCRAATDGALTFWDLDRRRVIERFEGPQRSGAVRGVPPRRPSRPLGHPGRQAHRLGCREPT